MVSHPYLILLHYLDHKKFSVKVSVDQRYGQSVREMLNKDQLFPARVSSSLNKGNQTDVMVVY